jgi:hypothetical protein
MKLFISSGRIGFKYISRYLDIDRRNFEIFIPKNLSKCVLKSIVNYFYPTQSLSESTNAILVYHEYGYPQKKEVFEEARAHGLYIIEDCAHSYHTISEDYNIGEMGNVSIYSLPKFFNCTMGGILSSKDTKLIDFIQLKKPRIKDYFLFYVARSFRFLFCKDESFFLKICYSFIEDIDFFQCVDLKADKKTDNQNAVKDILGIESLPYFLIFYPDKISDADSLFFKKYTFDVNRNLFNPDHKQMLTISLDRFLNNKAVQEVVSRNKSSFYSDGLL